MQYSAVQSYMKMLSRPYSQRSRYGILFFAGRKMRALIQRVRVSSNRVAGPAGRRWGTEMSPKARKPLVKQAFGCQNDAIWAITKTRSEAAAEAKMEPSGLPSGTLEDG